MTEWQQKGYDAWVELGVTNGYAPSAWECPARWLKSDSTEGFEFISGWNTAQDLASLPVGRPSEKEKK